MSRSEKGLADLKACTSALAAERRQFFRAAGEDFSLALDYLYIYGHDVTLPSRRRAPVDPAADRRRMRKEVKAISPSPPADFVARALERCNGNADTALKHLYGIAATLGFPDEVEEIAETEVTNAAAWPMPVDQPQGRAGARGKGGRRAGSQVVVAERLSPQSAWPFPTGIEQEQEAEPGEVIDVEMVDVSEDYLLGAHLVTPRTGYSHHGIYIGKQRVIHYSGWADGSGSGPVEIATIDAFSGGQDVFVQVHGQPRFRAREVVKRARSRLGENRYSLVFNNCEHFCNWCIEDEHESDQVNRGVRIVGGALGNVGGMRVLSASRLLRWGSTFGGGMTNSAAITVAAPVAVGVLVGVGVYKIVKWFKS